MAECPLDDEKRGPGSGSFWNIDNLIRGILGGLCLAGIIGGISLGRSDAGQDQRIENVKSATVAIEARQNRETAALSASVTRLSDDLQRERERREREMGEMRAYLIEILREVKSK